MNEERNSSLLNVECPLCGAKLKIMWSERGESNLAERVKSVQIAVLCSQECSGKMISSVFRMKVPYTQQEVEDTAASYLVPGFLDELKRE